ncbi:MAG: hypothetical protein HKN13_02350 [Rhodothermales bacterium]|nr:hypothetical protein [Rhodothermales bacterium]
MAATVAIALFGILSSKAVLAQESPPDSVNPIRADSTVTAPTSGQSNDSTRSAGPGFGNAFVASEHVNVVPMMTPYPEIVHSLSRIPGVMVHDLSAPGWAHGLSVFGSDPNQLGLSYAGISMDDLFFGRPRYEFVPSTTIDSIGLASVAGGRQRSFAMASRPYDSGRPVTEALYWTSNQSLQAVNVTHSQRRRLALAGNPGTLGLLFGYRGAGASGEYPSSKLQRGRQMIGRLRYHQERWSIELTELYNRGSVGQHDGVIPPIFRRLEASVAGNGARRQTRRNDLAARISVRAFGNEPISALLTLSRQTDVFLGATFDTDTLSTKTRRLGFDLSQSVAVGGATATFFGSLQSDAIRTSSWIADTSATGTSYVSTGARLKFDGPIHIDTEVAFESSGNNSGLGIKAFVSKEVGNFSVFFSGGISPKRQTLFEKNGFATIVDGDEVQRIFGTDGPSSSIANGRAGLNLLLGPARLVVAVHGTIGEAGETALIASELNNSLTWLQMESQTTIGYSGLLSLRAEKSKGLYLAVAPTLFPRSLPSDVGRRGEALSRPEIFVQGRLGARYTLFQGDLVANAYVRASYWSDFAGRAFHAPTALLVLPATETISIPSSSTVDFVLEAGVRTATIFVSYENALAGTNLLEGNLLVPGYPLAEQRFRLGVYWPIFD